MASAFKEGIKRCMGLWCSQQELETVNAARIGRFYVSNGKAILLLSESLGLRIIEPSNKKGGNGFWNCTNMAMQTEDVMHMMDVLEPKILQLHHNVERSKHTKTGLARLCTFTTLTMPMRGWHRASYGLGSCPALNRWKNIRRARSGISTACVIATLSCGIMGRKSRPTVPAKRSRGDGGLVTNRTR